MTTEPRAAAPGRARLFVALWPDAAVRAALLRVQAAWRWPPAAALTPPERLHLTLHFIGDVERTGVPALARALEAVPVEPVDFRLDTAEVWPGGVAVLRARTVPPPLARLHAAVRAAVEQALGQAGEARRFKPHATLARKAVPMAPPALPAAVPWAADRFALVESVRGAATVYRSLQTYGSRG